VDSHEPGLMRDVGSGAGPVGIFDSGVGGISVLKHIRMRLPGEDLIYCADSRYAPYGNKTPEFICERSMMLGEFLLRQGAKALVVACNTATAAAIAELRRKLDVPVIGMEPAVKPAVAATRNGVIGVLATVGTLQSARFAGLLECCNRDITVVTQGCPELVEQIEKCDLESDETATLLDGYLQPLLQAGADTIVLGCTHYPFVRSLIQDLVGSEITLIDTGAAVARQVENRLRESGLLAPLVRSGNVAFYSSSTKPNARSVIQGLWGQPVRLSRIL